MRVQELVDQMQDLVRAGLGEHEVLVSAETFGAGQRLTLSIREEVRINVNVSPARITLDAYVAKRKDAILLPPTPPRSNVP